MWKFYVFVLLLLLNSIYWALNYFGIQTVEKYSAEFAQMPLVKYNEDLGDNPEVQPGDCPEDPVVVAAYSNANTANHIFEYAAAWGLGKLLGRKAYAREFTMKTLRSLFPNLSLSPYEEIMHCNLSFIRVRENAEPLETLPERAKGYNLLYAPYHMLPGAVLPFVEEARVEFQFNDNIMKEVNETIDILRGEEGRTIVGVHVRRQDYPGLLKGRFRVSAAKENFYLDAMDWFRKNIGGNLIFAIVCDDLTWVRDNLISSEDVRIVMKYTGHDLALLCHADHTIIDYGTFGVWGALMSKGDTISLLRLDFDNRIKQYKNWHVFESPKYISRLQ